MVSRKERLSYWLRIIFSLIACLIAGCASLPELENRAVSTGLSLDESRATRLGQAVSRGMEEHPGKNGFIPLSNAMDAFAARMLLAGVAEKTLDAQYYIWHGDLTGTLLFEALHKSADRGVRVRLLLDDNNTPGLDMVLAALNAHPNIEVRLFNPFVSRKLRLKDYFFDFSRCNRRMHNKSFTVDNQVTIVGGRNIGDEYFGAAEGMLFADLDILAVGPVVDEVTADFDRYWASESSYPGELILKSIPSSTLDQLAETARSAEQSVAAQAYIDALRDTPFIANLLIGNLAMEWTEIRMVSDDPAKGLGRAEPEAMLPEQLREIIGVPTMDMELVSPYFVPTAAGVSAFSALARQGVNIRVLTNSLEATDVAPVHAGYAKWRKDLLAAGVTLYELRRIAPNTRQRKGVGLFVTSGSSLHAKTFSVDKTLVFVGSFNFDPRSTNLNTELGFVIESPALAAKIKGTFDALVPFSAYEVRLAEDGRLYWLEQDKDGTIRHDSEPGVGFWKRTGVRFISLLPIEWLL
ncbi:MAG TPA: phospholipase D family protein [Desulfonatronum sp.]|nr:phospholipase D family protein [Desulfonatronum sp.]